MVGTVPLAVVLAPRTTPGPEEVASVVTIVVVVETVLVAVVLVATAPPTVTDAFASKFGSELNVLVDSLASAALPKIDPGIAPPSIVAVSASVAEEFAGKSPGYHAPVEELNGTYTPADGIAFTNVKLEASVWCTATSVEVAGPVALRVIRNVTALPGIAKALFTLSMIPKAAVPRGPLLSSAFTVNPAEQLPNELWNSASVDLTLTVYTPKASYETINGELVLFRTLGSPDQT